MTPEQKTAIQQDAERAAQERQTPNGGHTDAIRTPR